MTQDLWNVMAGDTLPEISEMMNSWTNQPGFPLVTFQETPQGLLISQERFFAIPVANQSDSQKVLSSVPCQLIEANHA